MKATLLRLFAATLTGLFLVGAYAAPGDECTTADGQTGVEAEDGTCSMPSGE